MTFLYFLETGYKACPQLLWDDCLLTFLHKIKKNYLWAQDIPCASIYFLLGYKYTKRFLPISVRKCVFFQKNASLTCASLTSSCRQEKFWLGHVNKKLSVWVKCQKTQPLAPPPPLPGSWYGKIINHIQNCKFSNNITKLSVCTENQLDSLPFITLRQDWTPVKVLLCFTRFEGFWFE